MSQEPFKTSLIITTYNWANALKVLLNTVLKQHQIPDETIIADDGSSPETAEVISNVLSYTEHKWRHVRHEDQEVRQSRIKNLAVKYSSGDYLIFVDQDTFLHPYFIQDHLYFAQHNLFLQGKRVLLQPRCTESVLNGGTIYPLIWNRGMRNRKNGVRLPVLGKLLASPKPFQTSIRGCNLSMFRSDFMRVDGFDEIYDQSWGREDSDICYRLFHSGVQVRNLWFSAIQYHLFHKINTKWDRPRLDEALRVCTEEKRKKAVQGFSMLSSEGEIVSASVHFG